MSERRKQVRKCTSDYFIVSDRETGARIGRVLDLTTDGAMMISETEVPVPTTFQCKMRMPRMIGRHRFLFFDAESKWCRQNQRLGWYETGYRLVNVPEDHLKIIEELTGDWVVREKSLPLNITVNGQ